ncbi:RNA polymerase sigma factor [Peribacillus frigoritolerans]|uniref:RNA polymerase sigma factor n=1 Tax=Peribacillus castrilensis TaxID=2897690 RepID=UPI003DA3F111
MDGKFQIHLNSQLKNVFNYLIKIGATREDAEDIVQETAIKYVENIESVSPEKVKSWLFRVSINRFYDLLRKDVVKRKALLEVHLLDEHRIGLPDEYLIRQEMSKEVMSTLDNMSQRYRDFLILKYVFNLRYKDIASLYEVNEGTVKTTIFRAKENFIKLYEGGKK